MSNLLFNDSEVFQKERPTGLTDAQKQELLLNLANGIIADGFSTNDPDEIVQDLAQLYPFNDEGFDLANELKEMFGRQASYNFSTLFCEHLDFFNSEVHDVYCKNVKEWVCAHKPVLKFAVGSELIVTDPALGRRYKNGDILYVNEIREDMAQYCVSSVKNDTTNMIFDCERLESACKENKE